MSHDAPTSVSGRQAALGVLAGAVAVWALDRVDWALYRRESETVRRHTRRVRPGGEDPAHVIVSRVEGALGGSLSPPLHKKVGDFVHLAIGVGPAVAYALLKTRFPWLGAGRGAGFGLALFLLQDEGLNALTGLSASPRRYGWSTHARGLLAHLAYGLTLDATLGVLQRRPRRLALEPLEADRLG